MRSSAFFASAPSCALRIALRRISLRRIKLLLNDESLRIRLRVATLSMQVHDTSISTTFRRLRIRRGCLRDSFLRIYGGIGVDAV